MPPSVLVLSDYHDIVSVRPEAEIFVGLARAGFPVTVMTRAASPYLPRLREAGIRVVEWLPRAKWSLGEVRRLRAELVTGGHQVMVLCDNKALYCGPWAALGLPVKVVAYRGYDGHADWYDPTNYLKLLHPRLDAYWANAESVRETLRKNLLFRRGDRVAAIPKGHDVAWYEGTAPADRAALGVPAHAFLVGFVANVRPMKGVPDLLRATAFVRPERELHLVFAGAGMDAPELQALVAASPMRERLHVLGPRRDALQILAACDGYVCSSYAGESLTKSLMEAMSLGVPPVVTDVPGNRGIVVDGRCGRVVPARDPAALGGALDDLASDRARARRWGAAARDQIRERWSHAEAVRGMGALVERLAASPAHSGHERGSGPRPRRRPPGGGRPPGPLLLGFDAKRAFQNTVGLGNYSRDLLRILASHRPEHRYLAYGPRLVPGMLAAGVEARGPDSAWGRMAPALWRMAGLASQSERDGVQLFHGLTNELPLGIERSGVRSVVSIHDLIFERFPQLYQPVDRRIYRWKFRSAAERADLVIAISEQTRRDLIELYHVPPERIRVVYQGCQAAFQAPPAPGADEAVARRLDLPERYLLSVGTVERRKNLGLIVRALPGLPGVSLLVVGRRTAYAEEVSQEARRLGVEDRLRFLGSAVAVSDLAALYRRCAVFVFPSLFEGFGIPIIEALFCGAPVVTSAGGVFPEAGGPGSVYVDPRDADALRQTLAALLADEGRREAMRLAGLEHARRFTDPVIARSLFDVYEEALS